jgi:AhpD family alkylhydroperoxidase
LCFAIIKIFITFDIIIKLKTYNMKKLLFTVLLTAMCSIAFSQDAALTAEEKKEILAQSPFNNVYPTSILKSSDAYFKAQMGLYKEGAIAEKEAHLVALGTSAATKCQYCIPYHIAELKRLGASEDEIKTAVLIAADIMKMSTLFYGNEFDLEAFKKMLKGE